MDRATIHPVSLNLTPYRCWLCVKLGSQNYDGVEDPKSGKPSETCHKHKIGPALFYRWKDEMEKGPMAARGGEPQPLPSRKRSPNASSNWDTPCGGRIYRLKSKETCWPSELRARS